MGEIEIHYHEYFGEDPVRSNLSEVKVVLIDTDNDHLSVLFGEDCEYFVKLEDVKCVTAKGVEITYA